MKLRNVGYTQFGNHVDYLGAVVIRRGCELEVPDRVAAHLLLRFPGAFEIVAVNLTQDAVVPPVKRGPGRPRKVR